MQDNNFNFQQDEQRADQAARGLQERTADYQVKTPQMNFWKYFLTVAVTVLVTLGICLTVVFSLQLPGLNGGHFSLDSLADSRGQANRLGLAFEDTPENKRALEKLSKIYGFIRDNYYQELTDEELIEAMGKGLANSMESRYTMYLSPDESASMNEEMSGEYSGIGAIVQEMNRQFQIADLVDNSPALLSGLQVGDIFVSVDGKPASEFEDVSDLAKHIRGKEGTAVQLVIFRNSEKREISLDVERASIQNANVRSRMLSDDLGYLRVTTFDMGVSKNFIKAMDDLQAAGAKRVIFDLRGNTGGFVHEVVAMLDYLLPEGRIIEERGRSGGKPFSEVIDSDAKTGVPEEMTYAILTNRYTASASELFAGCLRDWGKAQLVGEKSFGKGVGTVSYDLPDGSSLNVTNFHYYLPNGENIDQIGLEPDYEVMQPEDQAGLTVGQLTEETDIQLKKAIEIIAED